MSKLHENLESQHKIKTASDFSFGITFSLVFLILGLLSSVKTSWAPIPFSASVFVALIALTKPSLLSPFNRAWTVFGLLISKITQPIIMFLLFYGFLTPFAFTYRLFGKKDLLMHFDSRAQTYWIKKQAYATLKESMKNQF